MAFLCCVEVGKVKLNEVSHTKGNDGGDVPNMWESCGFFNESGSEVNFLSIAIQK